MATTLIHEELFLDELSRRIYENSKDITLPRLPENLVDLSPNFPETKKLSETLDLDNIETIVIYGAGISGQRFFRQYLLDRPLVKVLFCDKNAETLKLVEYCDVITPQQLFEEYRDKLVVVAVNICHSEIGNSLRQNGVDNVLYYYGAPFDRSRPVDYWSEAASQSGSYVFISPLPTVFFGRQCLSTQPIDEEVLKNVEKDVRVLLPDELVHLRPPVGECIFKTITLHHDHGGVLVSTPNSPQHWQESEKLQFYDLSKKISLMHAERIKISVGHHIEPVLEGILTLVIELCMNVVITIPKDYDRLDVVIEMLVKRRPDFRFYLRLAPSEDLILYGV